MDKIDAKKVIEFAVQSWMNQVSARPLQNVHRRTLDSVWRQVIRFAGGDDMVLGPRHDDLLDSSGNPFSGNGYETGNASNIDELARKAALFDQFSSEAAELGCDGVGDLIDRYQTTIPRVSKTALPKGTTHIVLNGYFSRFAKVVGSDVFYWRADPGGWRPEGTIVNDDDFDTHHYRLGSFDTSEIIEVLEDIVRYAPPSGPLWYGSQEIYRARDLLQALKSNKDNEN